MAERRVRGADRKPPRVESESRGASVRPPERLVTRESTAARTPRRDDETRVVRKKVRPKRVRDE